MLDRMVKKVNRIFIDIPYSELKKAVLEAESCTGKCKVLPHGRFEFDFVNDLCGVRRIEEEDGQKINYTGLCCEALGGESTGFGVALKCRNCIINACRHKNAKVVKCDKTKAPECSKEWHLECPDCGQMIDLLFNREIREKAERKIRKYLKTQTQCEQDAVEKT